MDKALQVAVDAIQPRLIAALQQLVAIESVRGEAQPEAPYGPGPKQALEHVLALAEQLGFQTVQLANKIGYAQYGADRPDGRYFGVFGHVDVVELGQGWQHAPLGGEIEDGTIYGRGVLDNKGPILANLFALAAIKECGIIPQIPIRIVFGTNEETGFGCVQHYVATQSPPLFGWTPDCKWPVVYGERGRLALNVSAASINRGQLYEWLNTYLLGKPANGQTLGIDYTDEDFGELVMRGYQLHHVNTDGESREQFTWSIHYPASCTQAQLIEHIEATLPPEVTLTVVHNWDPILYDKDSHYVQTLQTIYNEVTGLEATPVTTTGGTYAKIVPNIIAYGPSFPGQRDIAHLPDEWMNLEDLCMCTHIYAQALAALANETMEGVGR